MKNIFLLLCLSSALLSAQQKTVISGTVVDQKTGEPLAYANVVYVKKSLGTFTNDQGYFTFTLQNAAPWEVIEFSYLGYKTLTMNLAQVLSGKTFQLSPDPTALEKVVVNSKVKFKVKPFVKKMVQTYNENRKNTPHISIAHYEERVQEDKEPILYMESIGYPVFMGTLENAAVYSNYKFFYDNSRIYLGHPKWKNRNANDYRPGASTAIRILRVMEHNGVLSLKQFQKYKYRLDSTYINRSGKVIKRISFEGKGEQGFLDVRFSDFHLETIQMTTNDLFSNILNKKVTGNATLYFQYYENTPYLSSAEDSYAFESLTHVRKVNILIQKFDDFKFTPDEYWSLNTHVLKPFITYDANEWIDFVPQKTTLYTTVKTAFSEQGIDLEEELKTYNNRYIQGSNARSKTEAQLKIKALKSNF